MSWESTGWGGGSGSRVDLGAGEAESALERGGNLIDEALEVDVVEAAGGELALLGNNDVTEGEALLRASDRVRLADWGERGGEGEGSDGGEEEE